MFRFLTKQKNDETKDFSVIAEKELRENKGVLESLRDYDTGKKDISTHDIERHVHDLQSASRS